METSDKVRGRTIHLSEDLTTRGTLMYKVCEMVRANHGPDGAVVLDIQRGRVLRLNTTGSFIFERLQQGEPEPQIIDGISQKFCISREIAQADVHEFLDSMEQEGLIQSGAPTVRQ